MRLQFRANFAGQYIEMRIRRIRRVHLGMRIEGKKAFSKRIRRCSVDGRKRYENDRCGRKSFWKRSKTPPFSFEKGLVWMWPYSVFYASINSSSAHPPPPGIRGAFAHVASPGGGAFAILSRPRGLGISVPRGDPRTFDTRVFERWVYREGRGLCQRQTCPSGTRKTCQCFSKGYYTIDWSPRRREERK